jgi:hypothetical protein
MEKRIAAPTPRSALWLRGLAVPGALAATLTVWVIAHVLGGIPLEVRLTPNAPIQEVGVLSIVVISLVVGVVAVLLVIALERLAKHPGRDWLVIAIVVLALSLFGPLGSAVTTGARVALLCMHLAAGAVLIPMLLRSISVRRESGSEAAA